MSSYEMMDENEMLENSEMPENNEMMENNEAAGQEQRGEAMGYSAYGERPRYTTWYSDGREAPSREYYTRTRNGHKEMLERAKFGLEPIPKEVMGGRTETGAESRKEAAEGGEAMGYSSEHWKHELKCAIANGNEIAAKNAKKNYASALVREGKYK